MRHWLGNTARGLCMGLSDAVPGVSGGTIALVLGIYPKLIEALSHIGPTMLKRALTRPFWARARRALSGPEELGSEPGDDDVGHVLFLASLGVGVVFAIAVGSRFLPTLLDLYPAHMRALFFGLVLASVMVPVRMIRRSRWPLWIFAAAAMVLTIWFVGLPESTVGRARVGVTLEFVDPPPEALVLTPLNVTLIAPGEDGYPDVAFGLAGSVDVPAEATSLNAEAVARMAGQVANQAPGAIRQVRGPVEMRVVQAEAAEGGRDPRTSYVFLAGILAISAMILPGISGSFVLLLLGLYHFVTHALRLTIFQADPDAARVVLTMVVAIVLGLLTAARILRWLFARVPDPTLAVLVGLMLGALRKLWPFVEYSVAGHEILVLPATVDGAVLGVVGMFALGAAAVLALEAIGRRARRGV